MSFQCHVKIFLLLVGIIPTDTQQDVEHLANKEAVLRVKQSKNTTKKTGIKISFNPVSGMNSMMGT